MCVGVKKAQVWQECHGWVNLMWFRYKKNTKNVSKNQVKSNTEKILSENIFGFLKGKVV